MKKKKIPQETVDNYRRALAALAPDVTESAVTRLERFEETIYNLRVDVDALKERLDWLESGEVIE